PSGMKVARSRMPSKTMRTGSTLGLAAGLSAGLVSSAALASPSEAAGLAAGVLSSGSGVVVGAPGLVVLKSSRKASSRYLGGRGVDLGGLGDLADLLGREVVFHHLAHPAALGDEGQAAAVGRPGQVALGAGGLGDPLGLAAVLGGSGEDLAVGDQRQLLAVG